jgi:DNA mismatch endonuclease (patch repair protein)
MRAQPQAATKPERRLVEALHARGLVFETQARVLPGCRLQVDIAFLASRVAVMVDGCFWHGCPQHATWPKANGRWWKAKIAANQDRDRATNAALEGAGWQVVRVWEHEDLPSAAKRIEETVESRIDEIV